MPWEHICPANRDGNCAFEHYNEFCNTEYWEHCFKCNGGHNPRIHEYKKNGKVVRIMVHVTEEDWPWGDDNRFKNGLKLSHLKTVYGDEP